MAGEDPDKMPVPPEDQDPVDPPGDPDPVDPPEKDPEKDQPQLDPDHKRAIQRRDRAIKDRDAAREEIRKLKEKYEPEKADPVAVANRRLVTAEARTVLTAKGITEKADQEALSGFLDLDSVSVSDSGEVDADVITERFERLAGIFGKLSGGKPRPPRLDTRDKGGDRAQPKDEASARRRAMLEGR